MTAASHNGDKFVYTVGTNYNASAYPTNSIVFSPYDYMSLGSYPFFFTYSTQTSGAYVARFQKPNAQAFGGHVSGNINAFSGTASYFSGGSQPNLGATQLIERCDVSTNTTGTTTLTNGIAAPSGRVNYNMSFDNNGVY
jgi:hypothetical protein